MRENGRIRVLVVDDSAFMRNALTRMITADHEFQVVGTARDGVEAVDKVMSLKPDIVTLDVEMPRMNGLEALRLIMDKHPIPVVMVSSLTTEGAETTLEALDLGAVDFIPKNLSDISGDILKIRDNLLRKLKIIARLKIKPKKRRKEDHGGVKAGDIRFASERRISVVAIGSSTGGPRALKEVFRMLPPNFPVPLVVAQHMPKNFTKPFAERLNSISAIQVKEAEDGEPLEPGKALIAPGGSHLGLLREKALKVRARIIPDNGEYIYKPSVDLLLREANRVYPGRVLGVILTGMGHDGLEGIKEMKLQGGRTIAESEETCVVYGMPRSIVEAGLADKVLPIDQIAGEIINSV